jgi:type I restriction enzyme S subunit
VKAGWITQPLSDACDVEYGTRVVRKQNGGSIYPVYGGGGATFQMDSFNREDCLIVSRFGMSSDCVRKVDGRFFLNDSGLSVRTQRPDRLLQAFLDVQLFAKQSEIYGLGKGTAQKNLDVSQFKALPISYPEDLAEQRRIVAVLDEAFVAIATAVANAEKNLANAQELFACELNKIFSIESENWTFKRLSEVACDFGRGKSRHRPRGDPKLYGSTAPLIQTGDVSNADHWLSSYTQMYSEMGVSQSKLWPSGTVCVAIVGANVGESAILRFAACFPDSVIGIVPDENISCSEYIEYMLQFFKTDLKEKGKGTARDNINIETFENYLMPFPDVSTQNKIVTRLSALNDAVREVERLIRVKLAALAELKHSLLNRALIGNSSASMLEVLPA